VKTLWIPDFVDEGFASAFRTIRDIDDCQFNWVDPVTGKDRACRNDNDQAVINDYDVTTDTAARPRWMPKAPSLRTRRVEAYDLIDAQQDPSEVG